MRRCPTPSPLNPLHIVRVCFPDVLVAVVRVLAEAYLGTCLGLPARVPLAGRMASGQRLRSRREKDQGAGRHQETVHRPDNPRSRPIQSDPDRSKAIQRDPTRSNAIQRDPKRSRPIPTDPKRSKAIQRDPTRSNAIQRDPTRSNAIQRDPTRSNDPTRSRPIWERFYVAISRNRGFNAPRQQPAQRGEAAGGTGDGPLWLNTFVDIIYLIARV